MKHVFNDSINLFYVSGVLNWPKKFFKLDKLYHKKIIMND